MAASDRGLPAVPRGLSREMTAYLQAVHNVILNMSGLGRGTSETRSVRASEVQGMVAQWCSSFMKENYPAKEQGGEELSLRACSGKAAHGETASLGQYAEAPLVVLTGFEIPVGDCGEIRAGISNLRLEDGEWKFDAVAACEFGEENGTVFYPGEISWLATGKSENGES